MKATVLIEDRVIKNDRHNSAQRLYSAEIRFIVIFAAFSSVANVSLSYNI